MFLFLPALVEQHTLCLPPLREFKKKKKRKFHFKAIAFLRVRFYSHSHPPSGTVSMINGTLLIVGYVSHFSNPAENMTAWRIMEWKRRNTDAFLSMTEREVRHRKEMAFCSPACPCGRWRSKVLKRIQNSSSLFKPSVSKSGPCLTLSCLLQFQLGKTKTTLGDMKDGQTTLLPFSEVLAGKMARMSGSGPTSQGTPLLVCIVSLWGRYHLLRHQMDFLNTVLSAACPLWTRSQHAVSTPLLRWPRLLHVR